MPRLQWPLRRSRPCVEVVLTLSLGGQAVSRFLLADTGAGSRTASFELVLHEDDCLHCGGQPGRSIKLSGAYSGTFPVYLVRVQLPAFGFDQDVPAVGVPSIPAGFDGIACFGFLNRFTYGNSGVPDHFGLEC